MAPYAWPCPSRWTPSQRRRSAKSDDVADVMPHVWPCPSRRNPLRRGRISRFDVVPEQDTETSAHTRVSNDIKTKKVMPDSLDPVAGRRPDISAEEAPGGVVTEIFEVTENTRDSAVRDLLVETMTKVEKSDEIMATVIDIDGSDIQIENVAPDPADPVPGERSVVSIEVVDEDETEPSQTVAPRGGVHTCPNSGVPNGNEAVSEHGSADHIEGVTPHSDGVLDDKTDRSSTIAGKSDGNPADDDTDGDASSSSSDGKEEGTLLDEEAFYITYQSSIDTIRNFLLPVWD